METLILVDEQDREIGTAEREEAHKPPGKLHRAILVVVKNKKGEFLLARRSRGKLFAGLWDGTVATDVLVGETKEEAASRALKNELGINNLPLKPLGHFIYRAEWGSSGVEHEFCHLFLVEAETFTANPEEISESAWANQGDLRNYQLTPWFLKTLEFL